MKAGRDSGAVRLVNGRFLDVAAGSYLPRGTCVTLEGGRIRSIAPWPESKDAGPVRTIDLEGRCAVPGLFSTHGHLQLVTPSLALGFRDLIRVARYKRRQIEHALADCLERGITNIQDSLTYDLDPCRALADAISRWRLPGPRLRQAVHVTPEGGAFAPRRSLRGRAFHAMVGMPDVDYESRDSGIVVFKPDASLDEVRSAVDRAIDERGAEYVKLYDQREWSVSYKPGATLMTQAQLDAAADRARERGVRTAMHQLTVESFRRAVRAGASSLVHVPFDAPLEEADVRDFVAAGCTIEPTLTIAYHYCWDREGHASAGHERTRELDRLRKERNERLVGVHWLPELQPLARRGMERASGGNMRMAHRCMWHVARYFSGYATHGMDNVRRLWTGGARDRIGCGNDAGATWCTHASIRLEIAMFELCLNLGGEDLFGPEDALRVASVNSARALGLESRFGTIEEGKVADLVLYQGNPLENMDLVGSRAAAVFEKGRLVVDKCGLERALS